MSLTFRRIRGRIVPMRLSGKEQERQSHVKKQVIAAGVMGVGSGTQLSSLREIVVGVQRAIFRNRAAGMKIIQNSMRMNVGGFGVVIGGMGYGVYNGRKAVGIRKYTKEELKTHEKNVHRAHILGIAGTIGSYAAIIKGGPKLAKVLKASRAESAAKAAAKAASKVIKIAGYLK